MTTTTKTERRDKKHHVNVTDWLIFIKYTQQILYVGFGCTYTRIRKMTMYQFKII